MRKESQLYISAIDNLGKGRNLGCSGWSTITGKSPQLIRDHWNKKKAGEFNITNRQVVGLDDIDLRKASIEKKRPPRILSEKEIIVNRFISNRLYAGEWSDFTDSGWCA